MTREDIFGLSAQLAYYFLLSLFPFLIFTVTLLGYLPIKTADVLSLVQKFAPHEALDLIESNIHSFFEVKRNGWLSFSIIATVWSATNGTNAIIRALNHAYEVKESRSIVKIRLYALILMVIMILVIVIALLLPVFGKKIGIFLFQTLAFPSSLIPLWNVIRWLASFCILYLAFVLVYLISPNIWLTFREVAIGALIASVGWQLVSLIFSFFVDHFGNYSATYGSLGGIIVLMLWFYISAFILLLGGAINAWLLKKT